MEESSKIPQEKQMDDVGVPPFRHVSKQVRHHSVALVRRFQLLVKVSCERLSCLRVQFLSLSIFIYIYVYSNYI